MKKILLIFICFFYTSLVLALNPPVQTSNDIIGCWERADFSKAAQKKINEIEPWPIRYQWYCFNRMGIYIPMRQLNTPSKQVHHYVSYSKHCPKTLNIRYLIKV